VNRPDAWSPRSTLAAGGRTVAYYPLEILRPQLATPLERLPVTVKILLENVLRHAGTAPFSEDDIAALGSRVPALARPPAGLYRRACRRGPRRDP